MKIFTHILAWSFYLLIVNLQFLFRYGNQLNVGEVVMDYLPLMMIFYFHSEVIFKLIIERKRYLIGAFFSFLALFLYFVYSILLTSVAIPLIYNEKPLETNYFDRLIHVIYYYLIFTFFSFGYYFAKLTLKREKELRIAEFENFQIKVQQQKERELSLQLQHQNLLLQQEKLQLEYAFLRSQINPHTLHNIFNMLYSKSIMANVPELGESILLVSNLMRYSLETATDENGCVLLDKEIEQIHNTIKINQLRSNDNLQINFQITGDTSGARIIPLVLISLVENAFKYAELTEQDYPLQLQIKTEGPSFVFYMHNKKKTVVVNETSHGIGQGNTIQRLKAAYGQNGYEMRINQDETTYTLQLTIYNLNKETIHTATTLNQPTTVLTA